MKVKDLIKALKTMPPTLDVGFLRWGEGDGLTYFTTVDVANAKICWVACDDISDRDGPTKEDALQSFDEVWSDVEDHELVHELVPDLVQNMVDNGDLFQAVVLNPTF